MEEFILHLNIAFTDEERKGCVPTAHRIIELAKIACEKGILSLKYEILEDDNNFLKMGVNLISDGVHPEYIEKICQYSILTSKNSGAELLDMLLISEGMLSIQTGLHLSVIAHILGSLIDEKYIPEIVKLTEQTIDLKEFFDSYYTPGFTSGNPEFEAKLSKLTIVDLSHVLATLDYYTLETAFHKCSKSFIHHIRNGLSENIFMHICKSIRDTYPGKEEVLNAQKQVIYNLATLEDSGSIIYLTNNES